MKCLITMFAVLAMAGCSSRPAAMNALQPELASLEAVDVNGRTYRPFATMGVASVLLFITVDCPIANGYAPEINNIVREYGGNGVSFYLVQADPAVRLDAARRHASEYGYRAPVLLDPWHQLARAVGATVTPEAAVVGRDLQLLYRGRIDDRVSDYGKKRAEPSRRDLREALDAIMAGRPVANARTKAVGCFIPKAL